MSLTRAVLSFPQHEPIDSSEVDEDTELSGAVIARILGVTDRRVRQLAMEGMPKARRGLYPLIACVQWYITRRERMSSSKHNALKDRKLELQIKLLQIKVEEAEGRVVDKLAMVSIISEGYRRLGRDMDRLPRLIAREFNISPSAEKLIQERLDHFRNQFVHSCREFCGPEAC